MASSKEVFLKDIEAFMSKHGMTATEFGRRFARSPNYVFDLRAGRAPTLDKVDTIDDAMKSYEEKEDG